MAIPAQKEKRHSLPPRKSPPSVRFFLKRERGAMPPWLRKTFFPLPLPHPIILETQKERHRALFFCSFI
jgi:hypothetical protein